MRVARVRRINTKAEKPAAFLETFRSTLGGKAFGCRFLPSNDNSRRSPSASTLPFDIAYYASPVTASRPTPNPA